MSGDLNLAIAILPPTVLESIDWRILDGHEKKKTPASDFLYQLFEHEAADILMSPADAEDLFDRTELLIALESAHFRLRRMAASGLWFWVPIGRFAWKDGGDRVLKALKEFEQLPADSPILKAGLLGGTPESVAEAVTAIRGFFEQNRGQLFF
jgi:hypothetical protein